MKTEFKVSVERVERHGDGWYECEIILPKGDGRPEDEVWRIKSQFEQGHEENRRATLDNVCRTIARAIRVKAFPEDTVGWTKGIDGVAVCKGYPETACDTHAQQG